MHANVKVIFYKMTSIRVELWHIPKTAMVLELHLLENGF